MPSQLPDLLCCTIGMISTIRPASTAMLFPLNLEEFEHYMLEDDSPRFPMSIPVELIFGGDVDLVRFQTALEQTVERHPLLAAKAVETGGKLAWQQTASPEIRWEAPPVRPPFIDLFQECGTQIFGIQTDQGLELTLFVHHSLADGLGIAQVVEDWMRLYQIALNQTSAPDPMAKGECLSSGTPPLIEPAPIAVERLQTRGRFGMNLWKYMIRPVQELCGLLGTYEYFSHRPVPLSKKIETERNSEADQEVDRNCPSTVARRRYQLDVTEFQELIKLSKATKFPVNDILLSAIYFSCYRWLTENRTGESDGYIRTMIPMNMRSVRDETTPMCNIVSMTFLDRRPGRYKSLKQLARYIWLEMKAIKVMRLGLTFIHLIRYFRKRNRLNELLRNDRSVATTILSNMGKLFAGSPLKNSSGALEAAGLELKSIKVFPPVRPYTWLTTLVSSYAGTMDISVSYDATVLTESDVDSIMATFKASLSETAFHRPLTESKS